jgi:hypothetical protein
MTLRIRSQIPLTETAGLKWMDDCGPTSLAMAIGWASKYAKFPTEKEAWEMVGKAGRVDRPDKGDGTSFAHLIKAAKKYGATYEYVRTCPDMLRKAKAGAAIILAIQASKIVIPTRALSKWQKKSFAKKPDNYSYGHYVVLAHDGQGWLYACPTMDAKKEGAVRLTQPEVDMLSLSKGVFPPPAVAFSVKDVVD